MDFITIDVDLINFIIFMVGKERVMKNNKLLFFI